MLISFKYDIRNAAVLCIIAVFISFVVNFFNPAGFSLIGKSGLDKRIKVIESKEAYLKFQKGDSVFIDARDEDEYKAERIPGSVNIPSTILKMELIDAMEKLGSDSELVLYCGAGCKSAENLAKRILENGFSMRLFLLKGGLSEWEKSGYPMERAGR
jgi:rhodanese-related sulfurtransferase